jgi:hypothetical protein
MKPTKIDGACGVVALSIAMTLGASAQASSPGPSATSFFSPTASVVRTTPAYLNPALPAQVGALVRAGVPVDRAPHAVVIDTAISQTHLVKRLETALGGAYGGVWFEPAATQLHVGVTSAAGRAIAEAMAVNTGLKSYVAATQVSSSWPELRTAQRRWNRRLAALFARAEVSTSISAKDNSVNINLSSSVPTPKRLALEREASADDVNASVATVPYPKIRLIDQMGRCAEFKSGKANCDPTIVGGVTIEAKNFPGASCTAGPTTLLRDLSKETTETFLLTAGHCIDDSGKTGEVWYAYDKTGAKKEEIGKAVAFLNKKVDMGVIEVDKKGFWSKKGANPPITPAIALWDAKKETEPIGVPGQTTTGEGKATCISGQVSGYKCGTVAEVAVTIGGVEGLVEVSGVKTAKGDSGAPWFSGPGETLKYFVEGTHVASVTNGNTAFQELEFGLGELSPKIDLELLIEANEKRLPCPMN